MNGLKMDKALHRRQFLQYAGLATAAAVTASACSKGYSSATEVDTVEVGAGNKGVLNILLAVEQFNAALYNQITQKPYVNISAAETAFITDIKAHTAAHRDFLKNMLGEDAIPTLAVDLGFVDFTNRAKTLAAAQKYKDLAVVAYNSSAYLLDDMDKLVTVFKIASVQARHASLVRNLISAGSFANASIVDDYGMDKQMSIAMILETLNVNLKKRLSAKAFGYTPF